ncbi:MAG TPA: hypothetical protein VMZ53_00365 [Kofleriaceae bacterium]|nr:hypothetical protein [Kofleriaceae bacterium]
MRIGVLLALAPVAACGRIAFDPQVECGPLGGMGHPYANSQQGADGIATPFLICSEAQLAAIAEHTEHWGSTFRLGADLDLTRPVAMIGTDTTPFTGALDGRDHVINHLRIDAPLEDLAGLFRYADGARFANLTFVDAELHGHDNIGVLAAVAIDPTIENIHVQGRVFGNRGVGGVVGTIDCPTCTHLVATDVTADIEVVATASNVGGVFGIVEATPSMGGVARIEGLVALGSVFASNGVVGGAIGYGEGIDLSRSTSSASVSTDGGDAGGLIADVADTTSVVRDSSASGQVSCTRGLCGGLSGIQEGETIGCHATGRIAVCTNECAGLIADAYGMVSRSYATGDVLATQDVVGGLVALTGVGVRDSYATGVVTGRDRVGGLFGATIIGLTIERSYATGQVTATSAVGGLGGAGGTMAGSTLVLVDSFATGAASGNTPAGTVSTLVGLNSFTVTTNAYWSAPCFNAAASCTALGTMVADASYFHTITNDPLTRWDFTNVWREVPGALPQLR